MKLSAKRGALVVALYAVLAFGLVALAGCATTQGAALVPLVPVSEPCKSAVVPDEPPRKITLNKSQPGDAVTRYQANHVRWIGYADALKTKLDACK
jgi:hypothetical protein